MGDQAHWPSRLILVKHGRPEVEAGVAPSNWKLSEEGRADLERLAVKLTSLSPTVLMSSPEPKAQESAAILGAALGLAVQIDNDLPEHRADRRAFTTQEDFEFDVARLFASPEALVMGEETGLAARERFDRAVARAGDAPVLVAHGRIITLWLSHRLKLDPMTFWKRLGLGSAAVVSRGAVEFIDP